MWAANLSEEEVNLVLFLTHGGRRSGFVYTEGYGNFKWGPIARDRVCRVMGGILG